MIGRETVVVIGRATSSSGEHISTTQSVNQSIVGLSETSGINYLHLGVVALLINLRVGSKLKHLLELQSSHLTLSLKLSILYNTYNQKIIGSNKRLFNNIEKTF